MADFQEKTPITTTVESVLQPPRPSFQASLTPVPSTSPNSPKLEPMTSNSSDDLDPRSAFYSHPATRLDLAQHRSFCTSKTHLSPAISAVDLEAARPSLDHSPTECSQWPSKATLRSQAEVEKRRRRAGRGRGLLLCSAGTGRHCGCWTLRSKRQRVAVKVLLALVVLGLAVGLGVGISRAVGGGVWAEGGEKPIPKI